MPFLAVLSVSAWKVSTGFDCVGLTSTFLGCGATVFFGAGFDATGVIFWIVFTGSAFGAGIGLPLLGVSLTMPFGCS
jgi:hypothetical protein